MKKIIFTIITVNVILMSTQVVFSTVRSSGGVELAALRSQIESLRQENNQIQSNIADKSSLANIETLAIANGLKPVKTMTLQPLTVAQADKLSQP